MDAGILGTGVNIPEALGFVGIKGWALGLAFAAAMGWGLKWAKGKLPDLLAGWLMKRVQAGLAGEGIENGRLKKLVHSVVLALVIYAEEMLPDEGLGPKRLAFIERLLCSVPVLGFLFQWILVNKPEEWREIVEACVSTMDATLKKAGQEGTPPNP